MVSVKYKPFMLSVIMLNVVVLSVIALSVVAPNKQFDWVIQHNVMTSTVILTDDKCRYAKWRYAKWRYAKWRYAEWRYASVAMLSDVMQVSLCCVKLWWVTLCQVSLWLEWFVLYGLRNRLVCLLKIVKGTDNKKDTSLLQNMSIFRKLQPKNIL